MRGLGHDLEPVALLDKSEFTDTRLQETDADPKRHEPVQVKLLENGSSNRREAAASPAVNLKSDDARIFGRTFLLYRPPPEPSLMFSR
ncbi:MAG TPA: YhbY family RNA-binding protein [Syntrophales bacterium]|nr:YhbY family RNA-binding protein [Syntrophales bacterium]